MKQSIQHPAERPLPDFVKTVASQRHPTWFQRFKRGVWDIVNFPNPPRVFLTDKDE